jgi:hypothetical protein|nr:MAG TPA: MDM2-binding [Caudoviricetes sp.]
MILHLDKYDDLYLNQLGISIAHCLTRIPCPPRGYFNSTCGLYQFCNLLQLAYIDVR